MEQYCDIFQWAHWEMVKSFLQYGPTNRTIHGNMMMITIKEAGSLISQPPWM